MGPHGWLCRFDGQSRARGHPEERIDGGSAAGCPQERALDQQLRCSRLHDAPVILTAAQKPVHRVLTAPV